MNSFIIDCTAMALIGQRVGKVLEKVEKTSGQFAKTPCSAYGAVSYTHLTLPTT